jgi:N-acetyl-anhydromuramyl-L-alanine amidase AmpD
LHDVDGKPATQIPIVVLHETVFSAISALNFFRTPHPNEDDQASYHTLIRRNGTITYLVPPDKRAYGAGNSVFLGAQGAEATRTKPNFPPSVNNFAYHVSLETPTDGNNNARQHSGYTAAQYQSLAWLVARTGVSDDRITTHQAVDRSGSRIDPRSFVRSQFLQLLSAYPRTTEIPIGCPGLIKPTLPTEPDPVLPPA